jgi:hypothetical protein
MGGRVRQWRLGAAVAVVAAMVALAGCLQVVPPEQRGERTTIEPSYIFTLGAHQNDILAQLGEPELGPRFDRLTQLVEVVYAFPFPAIQAETHFANGITRSEMVDRIHLFFDRNRVLVRMASRTNRWYSSVVEQAVQRVTVLPRLIHQDGTIVPVQPAPRT